MHFDDRLATALRQSGGSQAFARIQYRQLVDLLGTMPSELRSEEENSAYRRLGELSATIPADDRARILNEPGVRLRNPRLVAVLSQSEPAVAVAVIRRAELSGDQWLDLVPALPVQARGVMRHRRDLGSAVDQMMARLGIFDQSLPPPANTETAPSERADSVPAKHLPQAIATPPARIESIAALVERIESFRNARQQATASGQELNHPRLPLGDAEPEGLPARHGVFDFATDSDGRIAWASAAMAPMAIGIRLATNEPGSVLQASPKIAVAFRRRQPIRAEVVLIDGAPAISGEWRIDASPNFDPLGGRFTGYAGRMRRIAADGVRPAPQTAKSNREGDRIRQLLHELRTPINAIQGFAEVIQQQLFGPTPHEYRALAASIAGDAARMLAGFEELERLARLETGAMEPESGECDFADVLAATIVQLEAFTGPRGSGFSLRLEEEQPPIALARGEAERLIWRLLATLAAAAAPGEVLKSRARERDGGVLLTLQLPEALASRSDQDLFRASAANSPQALSSGMFGSGFALRLATAEAAAAGGSLKRIEKKLKLFLPGLTKPRLHHSQ